MRISIEALAAKIGGKVVGDGAGEVSRLLSIDDAEGDALSPLFKERLLDLRRTLPAAVLTHPTLATPVLERGVPAAIVHETPALLLARAIDHFHPPRPSVSYIHSTAAVDASADVHETARIGPFAVVEADVRIGEYSVVGAHAVIARRCVIGDRVVIGPGAIIGHEGFGFVPTRDGAKKIRQVGRVVIEDDVEVGANTCIDRATLGSTRIGRGAKIDNLVQIGHNVTIGDRVLIAGQAGVAGSATIESRAMLGGQAGIADHLTIGEGALIAAKSGVIGDVPPGAVVAGYPAMPRKKWLKAMANLKRIGIVDDDTEVS